MVTRREARHEAQADAVNKTTLLGWNHVRVCWPRGKWLPKPFSYIRARVLHVT